MSNHMRIINLMMSSKFQFDLAGVPPPVTVTKVMSPVPVGAIPPPKRKVIIYLFESVILTESSVTLKDTYDSLDGLLTDLGNSSGVQMVFKNLHRVQQMSWGEFLHSTMYSDWLHRIILGKEVVTSADYDFARDLIQLLPGYSDVADFVGRPWSPYEDTYPGRFIGMQQLKHEIMQVILFLMA